MSRLLVLLFLLALAMPGWAEPAPPEPTPPEPVHQGEDLVVTGSLQPLKLSKSPANVSTVPAARLRKQRALDVAEVLPQLPGVFIRRSGPTGALATFSVRGSASTETQVMLDGRPLNQPSVGIADLSVVPADLVDRAEVVRGPYSALYGPYSMSGTLQLVTRKGRPGANRVQFLAGGLGTNAFTGDFSFGSAEGPVLRLVPTVRRSLGNRPNSDSSLGNLFARFDAPLGSAERSLTLSGGFTSAYTGTPGPQPAAGRALRTPTQLFLGDDEVSSTVDHQNDQNAFLDARLAWDGLEAHAWSSSWIPQFHYEYLDFLGTRFLGDARSAQAQTGLDLRYRVDGFTVGATLENSRLESRSSELDTVLGTSTVSGFDASRQVQSLYLEESLQLDRFAASLGVRVDKPSDFPEVVSPRASVLWRATDWLSLRGGWGRGYRPPTLFELNLPTTAFSAGNPALRPQTSTSTEGGVEALLGDAARLRVTAFREDSKDRITFAPVGPMGSFGPLYVPENLDRFRKVGWEAELQATLAPGLSLTATHARLDAVQVNQELVDAVLNTLVPVERPAAQVPASLSSVVLDWKADQGPSVLLQGQWVGPRVNYYANYLQFPVVTQDTKRLPAYNVFDLVVSQEVDLWGVRGDAFLKVTNLFDTPYSSTFGSSLDDRDYPMPGRTVFFGLSPRF